MEAAPDVAFHQQAPDLMTEENVQSAQPEASDAEDMLPTRPWPQPQHDDAENDRPPGHEQHRARVDISHELNPSCQGLLKQEEQDQAAAQGGSLIIVVRVPNPRPSLA